VYKPAVVRSVEINPIIDCAPLLVGQFYTMVATLEDAYQLAGRGVIFVGFHDIYVGLGALAIYIGMEV
jgi:hypothetical protein